MSGDFIDSNIFIYLFENDDPTRSKIASDLIESAPRNGTASISFQVVQETLNVITRKLAIPVTAEDARDFLDKVMKPLWRVMRSLAFHRHSLEIQARYRYGFYDSLIVAAALNAGSTCLYSEDFRSGQRIEGLTIKNPFASCKCRRGTDQCNFFRHEFGGRIMHEFRRIF